MTKMLQDRREPDVSAVVSPRQESGALDARRFAEWIDKSYEETNGTAVRPLSGHAACSMGCRQSETSRS